MLELRSITKTFPGVIALDDVSLTFHPGEIHALVGENGAGKSTMMKIITGIYQPDVGEMFYRGQPLRPRSYRDSLRAGIDIVHQEIQVIPESSVAENIMLDKLPTRGRFGRVDWNQVNQTARSFMDRVGLNVLPATPMKWLSAAQKQLAQIAKALAADASLLLLDEPTSSLTSFEADRLFSLLRELRSAGKTIIFVSHKFEELFALCDRASVLRDGKCVASRPIAEWTNESLVSQMIGRAYTLKPLGPSTANRQVEAMRAENIVRRGSATASSFTLYEGEILGFYGLIGAGRTELARALIGAEPVQSGQLFVHGKPVHIRNVGDSLGKHGIAYVSENRKEEGLLLKSDVQTNITITVWPDLANPATRRIDPSQERSLAQKMVDKLSIRTPGVRQLTENLSGGNQQKVCLAKALARDNRILIIDEPTVGVDIGAKEQIHEIIYDLASREKRSVIVISSDMPEIIRLASRIMVFREGQIIGEVADLDSANDRFRHASAQIARLMLRDPGGATGASSYPARTA